MSPKSYFISGLATVAVMLAALPAAKGIGTPSNDAPQFQVNRAAKGDRFVEPRSIAVKKIMIRAPGAPSAPPTSREQSEKREPMDGCEPAFSPVTMPSMAHISGRCIG
jgi:hypothetical protein